MPPQFFKDAQNGLGNKFVPRAFAFGAMSTSNSNQPGTSHHDVSISPDTSGDAHSVSLLPQASSTATSSASAGNFFKDRLRHDGGNAHNISISNTSTGSVVSSQSDSVGNVSGTAHGPLTLNRHVENSSTTVEDDDDDDDIQITDERVISGGQADEEEMEGSDAANETSGDYLLEALYKSQKLCSSLREKLDLANSKLQSQEEELLSRKRTAEKMREDFAKFKAHLADLEAKSSELKTSRSSDNKEVKQLKEGFADTQKKMQDYKQKIIAYQLKMEHLKQIKTASNYEVDKKNKEIKALKGQLDDTQGLLSEQKIRTVHLEKMLENTRKEYDAKVDELFAKTEKLEGSLAKYITEGTAQVEKCVEEKVTNGIGPMVSTLKGNIDHTVEALSEKLIATLKLGNEGTKSEFKVQTNAVIETFKVNIETVKESLDTQITEGLKSYTSIEESMNSLTTALAELAKSSQVDGAEARGLCKKMMDQVCELQNEIHQQNVQAADINEWKKKYTALQDEASKLTQLSSAKDLELQNAMNQIQALESSKAEASQELTKMKLEVNQKDRELSTWEEKLKNYQSNTDGKLRSQVEHFKLLNEERDEIRKDLESTREKVLELQTELTRQQSIQIECKKAQKLSEKIADEKEGTIQSLKKEASILKKQIDALQLQYQNELGLNDLSVIASPMKTSIEDYVKPFPEESVFTATPTGKSATQKTLFKSTKSSSKYTKRTHAPKATLEPVAETPEPVMKEQPAQVVKKEPVKNATRAPTVTKSNKVNKPTPKRKILDEPEKSNIFDDFDLDELHDLAPAMPKRYTKRKRTTHA